MDEKNKQFIGHLLMTIVGGGAALGVYYLGKLSFDPILIGILIAMVGAAEITAYRWIKYNFQIPEEEEPLIPPSNIVNLSMDEWQLVTYTADDGTEKSYWEKK